MDKGSKLLFQRDVEKYLESKGVYDIFEDLLKSVLISKPNDPIDHMIQKLNEPERTFPHHD
jgi:adenylate kinase